MSTEMQNIGWSAAAPATGAEQVWGIDAGGNVAAMPLSQVRSPGLANWDPSLLQRWRRARARVATGTSKATLLCHGDSTTAGSNGTSMGPRAKAYPARLAVNLAARGVPAASSSWIGDGGTQSYGYSLASYDPTIALGGGASFTSNVLASLGGATVCLNTAGDSVTWTPGVSCDTIDVYYVKYSSGGTFSYAVDGGSATTVSSNATTAAMARVTVSLGSLGSAHSLKILCVTSQNYVQGMVAYSSTSPAVNVLNGGRCGWTSTQLTLTTNSWSPLSEAEFIAPDLVIYDGNINDWVASAVSVATAQANVTNFVTGMQTAGSDVVLKVPFPSQQSGNTYGSATTMFQYRTMLYSLAKSLNVPLIDLFWRYGGPAGQSDPWTVANNLGYMGDSLHPLAIGYDDEAQWIAALLAAV